MTWLGPPSRDLGLPTVELTGTGVRAGVRAALALRRSGADIVLVSGTDSELASAVWVTTLAGAGAVLLFPTGAPRALPRWARRFHRYVLADQDTARAWARAGAGLGRVFVLPGAHAQEALEALIVEVRSMAR